MRKMTLKFWGGYPLIYGCLLPFPSFVLFKITSLDLNYGLVKKRFYYNSQLLLNKLTKQRLWIECVSNFFLLLCAFFEERLLPRWISFFFRDDSPTLREVSIWSINDIYPTSHEVIFDMDFYISIVGATHESKSMRGYYKKGLVLSVFPYWDTSSTEQ